MVRSPGNEAVISFVLSSVIVHGIIRSKVISTEAYNRVEACNTCYNVISTEAYNRIEACNTCYNVISTEAYNRIEACNTWYL